MKISDNFDIRELVHPDIYNHPAIGVRCVDFIHPATARTLETLKKETGDVITVNDWLWKGVENANYVDSGLRMPVVIPSKKDIAEALGEHGWTLDEFYEPLVKLFKGVGAPLSSHRFGCGFDLKFKHNSPQRAHAFILEHQKILFPNITRMEAIEKTPTWAHIEIGAARAPGVDIAVFNP